MNDTGFVALVGAVLLRAMHDVRSSNATLRQDAEQFLKSEWAKDLAERVFDADIGEMAQAASQLKTVPQCGLLLEYVDEAA